MAQRQTNMARQVERELRQARETRRQIDAQHRAETWVSIDCEASQSRAQAAWDALKVGDTLAAFGHPQIKVAKKNAKSIRDGLGNRWSRAEIAGF